MIFRNCSLVISREVFFVSEGHRTRDILRVAENGVNSNDFSVYEIVMLY